MDFKSLSGKRTKEALKMKFENIKNWIDYLKEISIEDLTKVFNKDFSLEEMIHNKDVMVVEAGVLKDIKDKIKGLEIEKIFWNELLRYIDTVSLKDELINYLIDNHIADLALGHLPLDDRYLWQLAYQVDDGLTPYNWRLSA